jgi:hypothetical protein
MSKHPELGPEPLVNMGDHEAAQKRADEIDTFIKSTAYRGVITNNERINLYHLRKKWLRRASGEDWYFEHFGTEPRAYTLLEFKVEGGLRRMRRSKEPGNPFDPAGAPKHKQKIRYDDPERTGFEEPEDLSYAGTRTRSGRVKNTGGERTLFDRLYDEADEDYGNTPE